MKKQIKTLILTILAFLAGTLTVHAADATASINLSKSELERGETFTATLNVVCEEGINGLEATVSYDEENLELVDSQVGDTINWTNLGEDLKFEIIHAKTNVITSADMIKLTFKVKDTATNGTTAKITLSEIIVDSDASTNSEKIIGTKEVEISVVERLRVNISEYLQEQQGENKYIKKINPKIILENFVKKISTNGIIEIFKGTNKITDNTTKISTGMTIKVALNDQEIRYKSIVLGDVNGDGEADFSDILQINKHRLNKAPLQGEYLKAGDVTEDGGVDFSDILKVNKYRLGKINSL